MSVGLATRWGGDAQRVSAVRARATLTVDADSVCDRVSGLMTLDLDYRRWLMSFDLKSTTVEQRVAFLRSRLTEWGTLDVAPADVSQWLRQFEGWTRRTYLFHLRSIYTFLLEQDSETASPIARFRTPPTPRQKPNPLSPDQRDRVFAAATGDLRTWLLIAYYTGLRCHEIAKLRGEDINEYTLFVRGKGDAEWQLPTHPALWAIAQGYPQTGYWFPSTQRRREYVSESQVGNKIRALFREQGIEKGSIHRLRHTYLTELSRAGVPARVLQELARHASLTTTQGYIDVTSDEKMNAIRLLPAA